MKRGLIPLLLAGAWPLAAVAQSSVTAYGLLDLGMAREQRGNGSVTLQHNLAYPSRIGFRGSEDLGGGLSALFIVEGDLAVDVGGAGATGTGLDFQRVSVVGLKGGFGEVQFGRNYTPGFLTALNHDNLAYGYYNSLLVFTASAGGITTRYSNAIFYNSPAIGGLTVRAAWAFGERSADPRKLGDNYGVGLVYKTETLALDAYAQVDHVGVPAANPSTAPRRTQAGAGLQWKLPLGTLSAGYGQARTDGLDNKTTGLNLGITVPVGELSEVLVHLLRVKTHATSGTDPEARAWGLTYRHFLSKRTTVYATAGQTRNNTTGSFALFSTKLSAPAAAGADPRGLGVGVMHRF